jgi:predicted O-linked N-acetylglucosamine transferase (SPINDLY family)
VECLPYLGYREYLAAHGEADLHLDSFPYPGVTVAATALWMGLPSVCVAGSGAAGREGASQLAAAGFPELIARDEGEYIAKYLAFGRDLEKLSAFRKSARARMAGSRLLDPAGLARQLEAAYAGMLCERGIRPVQSR